MNAVKGRWYRTADNVVMAKQEDGSVIGIADCRTVDTTPDEGRANANLMAAAPDLYENLRDLVRLADVGLIPNKETLQQANAALAKARGEQP